ncbi:hypothetical protein B0H11DRAFT_1905523 [Mycena galericulata]|nr:hypothetical protein B0H11DRAFT_1905523 [Mycena galericulata]
MSIRTWMIGKGHNPKFRKLHGNLSPTSNLVTTIVDADWRWSPRADFTLSKMSKPGADRQFADREIHRYEWMTVKCPKSVDSDHTSNQRQNPPSQYMPVEALRLRVQWVPSDRKGIKESFGRGNGVCLSAELQGDSGIDEHIYLELNTHGQRLTSSGKARRWKREGNTQDPRIGQPRDLKSMFTPIKIVFNVENEWPSGSK